MLYFISILYGHTILNLKHIFTFELKIIFKKIEVPYTLIIKIKYRFWGS